MEQAIDVCHIDELAPGTSRGFSVAVSGVIEDIFLVRTASGIVAYRNSCPHTGGPLDWVPHQFLSIGGDFIQCATHDALFRIEDGSCVKGPCAGRSLTAVRVQAIGPRVCVWLDAPQGAAE